MAAFRRLCGDAPAGRLAVALGGEVRRVIRGCGDSCARRRSGRKRRRRGLAACAGAHAVLCGGFSDRAQLCRGVAVFGWRTPRSSPISSARRGGMGEPAASASRCFWRRASCFTGSFGRSAARGGAAALPGRARRHDGAGRRAAVHGGAAVRGLCARCGGVRRFGRIRREGRAFRRDRPPAQRRAFCSTTSPYTRWLSCSSAARELHQQGFRQHVGEEAVKFVEGAHRADAAPAQAG